MTSPLESYTLAPKGAIKTSHSEIELFAKCERAHYYGYGKKLQSKKPSDALLRGSTGHECLATYYTAIKDGESVEDASNSALAKLIEFVNNADSKHRTLYAALYDTLDAYFENYADQDSNLEILAVEQEFNIPVGPDFYIKMFVDLVVREPGEGLVAWDHKFVWDFLKGELIGVLPQLPKYMGALQSGGIKVNKLVYNQVRYRDTKSNEANPSEKFERLDVPVNKERVIRTMQEQISAAKRIRSYRESGLENWEKSVLRAGNSIICKNCAFLDICSADMRGEDTALMEEYYYAKKGEGRNG